MSPAEALYECYIKEKESYPKTFEECCSVLSLESESEIMCQYRCVEIESYHKLLICRDAYYKIDNYKPEFSGEIYYYICPRKFINPLGFTNCCAPTFLAFQSGAARDAFYENFKELIEDCKELL